MKFVVKTFEELTTKELYEILKARCAVFTVEQNIICQDMDGIDYRAMHCFFEEEGRVEAYLRAFYLSDNTVKIGRVLTAVHGKGLGRKLMDASISAIKEKMPCKNIHVSAHKNASGFYERMGFKVTSVGYMEDDIVHIAMDMELK